MSNRDWFSLKLKLDDFTSGFRTRYANMAGGWEELVAVVGGIRTGAGTGVELDKQNKADGAAEGKILAGGAAAEQANCIWLISGETMTLNFLNKSMPRMVPATAACRNVDVKSLLKPQEGMGWPSAPLRRAPVGLEYQIPIIGQFVSQKNQASVCRKMHSRGSGMCGKSRRTERGLAADQFSGQEQGGMHLLALLA